MPRPIYKIASEIEQDWKPAVDFAARPYLTAMHALDKMEDFYGCDSGKSIILYFLSNTSTWRGETARRIKKELKDMIKKEGD